MNNHTTPTCPACGYDLTGLIEPDTSANCPECNARCTHHDATLVVVRWSVVRFALIWFFLVPLVITAISFAFLATNRPYNLFPFAAGAFLIVELGIIVGMLVFISSELKIRKNRPKNTIRPAFWVVEFFLIIPLMISLALMFQCFQGWIAMVENS